MNLTNLGSYAVYAGVIVGIANHFGLNLIQSDVEGFIAVVAIIVGAIYQHFHTNKLAVQAGLNR